MTLLQLSFSSVCFISALTHICGPSLQVQKVFETTERQRVRPRDRFGKFKRPGPPQVSQRGRCQYFILPLYQISCLLIHNIIYQQHGYVKVHIMNGVQQSWPKSGLLACFAHVCVPLQTEKRQTARLLDGQKQARGRATHTPQTTVRRF